MCRHIKKPMWQNQLPMPSYAGCWQRRPRTTYTHTLAHITFHSLSVEKYLYAVSFSVVISCEICCRWYRSWNIPTRYIFRWPRSVPVFIQSGSWILQYTYSILYILYSWCICFCFGNSLEWPIYNIEIVCYPLANRPLNWRHMRCASNKDENKRWTDRRRMRESSQETGW